MAGGEWERADFYRQRAQMLMRRAEASDSEEAHRTWFELATAWFELAKRAEELEKAHKENQEKPKL
jgi:hypothetical protein